MRQTIILASSSPRREELLKRMGVPFIVRAQAVDESIEAGPREAVLLLAGRKARAAADGLESGLVLGADTLVALDGRAMGKPADEREARRMLRALSGRAHEVFTGVCLLDAASGREMTRAERTRVAFRALDDEEIDAYVRTGEPMGKAGAYAIQGLAGAFVSDIDGSCENVMGLPIQALRQMLDDW